ncbi:MAG TPA: VanZ family protein [Actinomycetes bacterium]|nr:VanZ family protein [Actinomycetes bacterium]
MTSRGRDRALLAVTVAVQLAVLYWPRAAGEGLPYVDKLVHAAVFGAVAWAGRRAGVPHRVLVPLLVVQAVVSEVVQDRLLPGRSGDPADVVADLVGTGLGLLLAHRPGTSRRVRASWRA